MTQDQITALRAATEPGYVDMFDRMAEERKRLLEALEIAVALREGFLLDANGVPSGELRAAIAFARESTP